MTFEFTKDGLDDGKSQTINLILQKNGSVLTESAKISMPKGIEIPESWKKLEVERHKPTEEDWAFVKSAMTDLSEGERNRLISESKNIYEGNSTLAEEEQKEILQKLGHYIVKAIEGDGVAPLWWGSPGHWHMSRSAGENLDYVTSGHIDILGDYSWWADDNRHEPSEIVPWWGLNRHSWVIDGPGIPGFDNMGPDSCEYFMDDARENFSDYDVSSAYIDIGKSLHYIKDLGCPFHTSTLYGQAHHSAYEEWVATHWDELDSATDVDVYYIIDDPSEDSKLLAGFSHQYLQPICDIMNFDPDWQNSSDLVNYTRTLITETEKMTMGMNVYASTFESPETIGSNSVPIYDHQTSYAYINDVSCSETMVLPTRIDHTYIGDLEIWIGWKDDPTPTYTEAKIWDREGGGADHLVINVWANGFQNTHDWRLRVHDAATGDEGEITEFSISIG